MALKTKTKFSTQKNQMFISNNYDFCAEFSIFCEKVRKNFSLKIQDFLKDAL